MIISPALLTALSAPNIAAMSDADAGIALSSIIYSGEKVNYTDLRAAFAAKDRPGKGLVESIAAVLQQYDPIADRQMTTTGIDPGFVESQSLLDNLPTLTAALPTPLLIGDVQCIRLITGSYKYGQAFIAADITAARAKLADFQAITAIRSAGETLCLACDTAIASLCDGLDYVVPTLPTAGGA